MREATARKLKPENEFERQYHAALADYARGGGEPALRQGYELGRQAIAEGRSLLEIAALHHQMLEELLSGARKAAEREQLLRAGGTFLAEFLSSYEMAHRGFQDAIQALQQLNETLEQEIKRIAYSVHDEAGQLLVAVHLGLAEVAREASRPQQEKMQQIEQLLLEVEKQLRRYSHELRPTVLDDLGWIPAVRFLAEGVSKRANLAIEVEAELPGRPPEAVETALYRVVQESLTNAVKHAAARHIWVRAWQENSTLCCSVRDDGRGFDAAATQAARSSRGLGLIGMRERLHALGGSMQIVSRPGQGTEILLRVPVEDSRAYTRNARR